MPDEGLLERARARVGTTLRGKYHIDRVLGAGGMAVVYAATHRNKKKFAIKMLHPELTIQGDAKQRFLREGYVANTVEHPGAVAVLDDDIADDGGAFIVMELLEGVVVDELAEKHGGRLPARAVLVIADQLLAVLEAAHSKEIVHRDLKPANLFVLRDGTLKVLDFGIARLREAVASGPSGATQTGALMGTPAFLPPEQAGGRTKEIDGQTDIWAVGATMFTLLGGEYVHVGENATQMVIAAATKPARSLATVFSGPPTVVGLVDRALAFDKAARWPSAPAMRAALQEVHRALFGVAATHGQLVELLVQGSSPDAIARTQALPQRGPVAIGQAGTLPAAEGSGKVAVAVGGVGGTTSQPVSSEAVPSSVAGVPKRKSTQIPLLAGGGVLALAVIGIAAFALKPKDQTASAPTNDTPTVRQVPTSSVTIPTTAASVTEPTAAASVATPVAATTHVVATRTDPNPRAALETRVFSTHGGSSDDVNQLKALCKAQGDKKCLQAIDLKYPSVTVPAAPSCEYVKYTDESGIPQMKKVCK